MTKAWQTSSMTPPAGERRAVAGEEEEAITRVAAVQAQGAVMDQVGQSEAQEETSEVEIQMETVVTVQMETGLLRHRCTLGALSSWLLSRSEG